MSPLRKAVRRLSLLKFTILTSRAARASANFRYSRSMIASCSARGCHPVPPRGRGRGVIKYENEARVEG